MLLGLLLWRDMTLNLCLSSLFSSTFMKLFNITSRVNYKRRLNINVFHCLPAESDLNICHRTTLLVDYHYHQSPSTGFHWQLSSHDLSSFLWDSTDFSLITIQGSYKSHHTISSLQHPSLIWLRPSSWPIASWDPGLVHTKRRILFQVSWTNSLRHKGNRTLWNKCVTKFHTNLGSWISTWCT